MLMSMAADVNAIGDNIVGATANTNRYANADFNVGAIVSAIGNYNTDANSHFKFDKMSILMLKSVLITVMNFACH